MGASGSKHRSVDLSSTSHHDIEETQFYLNMEGPSFYCAYLGYTALSKPPTNLSVLQSTVKDLYFQYRRSPATGRSASLKLIQSGVLVILYENGAVKAELFFDFSSVTFVEGAKFSPVKTSSERKPKAMFVPLDESKGAQSDKNAFLVDKSHHFLISSTHPPLVLLVVRRPTGVKALDCHVFALDTIENALHITALIASAQTPTGQLNKMEFGGQLDKGKSGFDRVGHNDVIRTDHGDYSLYRGPQSYESPPLPRYSGGFATESTPGHWQGHVQSPGRNGHGVLPASAIPGSIILTQDNFRESPASSQPYVGAPATKTYVGYEQPGISGTQVGGYYRQPDVIMHARQRSGDSTDQATQDRSFTGPDPTSPGYRMRVEEVNMRNSNHRVSGPATEARLSGGPVLPGYRLSVEHRPPSDRLSPRPSELPTSSYTTSSQWHPDSVSSPSSPNASLGSPRSAGMTSPTSSRGFHQVDVGGVFSASNLESRNQSSDAEVEDPGLGSRPVAKVPPHMIGVKVLPSDFRMVKLKHNVEKRSEQSGHGDYDNNKELLEKYNEIQHHPPAGKANSGIDRDGFHSFEGANKGHHDDRPKDYFTSWNDTVTERRTDNSQGLYNSQGPYNITQDMYRHNGPRATEDNNNKNRYSSPSYSLESSPGRNWGPRSQSSYDTGGLGNQDPYSRTKDLEIANMFSNMRVQEVDGRDLYRQPRDRNVIEEGLGYLP